MLKITHPEEATGFKPQKLEHDDTIIDKKKRAEAYPGPLRNKCYYIMLMGIKSTASLRYLARSSSGMGIMPLSAR